MKKDVEDSKQSAVFKYSVIFLQSIVYAVFFYLIYRVVPNGMVTTIDLIPITFVSLYWGRAAGFYVVAINMVWTVIIIRHLNPAIPALLAIQPVLGILIHLGFALVVGTLGTLTKKLKIENKERQEAQKQLREYQNHLEEIVQKRTKELQRVNERLRQVEKMEAIGQLAGGIAHDFNNQLTIVLGYCELLSNKLSDNPQLLEYLQQINNSGKRASDLTKQLLAFARKGVYKRQVVNVHEIIQEVIALLSRSINKNITIEHNLESQKPFVWGGATQLQNAILNLSLNARDAMESGGTLTFETADVSIDEQYCGSHNIHLPNGSYISISVRDTGCGMDAEVQKHLFEPFFTTKEEGKGTGMGLAAVYGIVKIHKGNIIVQSTPGNGATFRLLLPQTSKVGHPNTRTIKTIRDFSGISVLIIDDEEAVAKTIKDMLTGFGFTVTTCYSGREAVEIYRMNWKTINIIIIDMVMPDFDGRETFFKMREINPNLSTIISSGFALTKEIELMLKAGANTFLQKPYNQQELVGQIEKILAKKDLLNIDELSEKR
ncbi:MAG: response regulator [Fibrobacter sp.]|nr:response regulator [Fibrobacter sp.]